jgi:hypothetical protein
LRSPSATSRPVPAWNKIEHRLFSFISRNWGGQPLISYEVIVNLISATTPKHRARGLRPSRQERLPKVEVTDAELAAVNLTRDPFHGEWNYSISPSDN